MKNSVYLMLVICLLFVLSCVSTSVTKMSANNYPATDPESITVYLDEKDIPGEYEKIALIYSITGLAVLIGLFICALAVVLIVVFGTDSISLGKWRRERKPKPVKQMPKYLALMYKVIERQDEAEKQEQQIKEMKDENNRSR